MGVNHVKEQFVKNEYALVIYNDQETNKMYLIPMQDLTVKQTSFLIALHGLIVNVDEMTQYQDDALTWVYLCMNYPENGFLDENKVNIFFEGHDIESFETTDWMCFEKYSIDTKDHTILKDKQIVTLCNCYFVL